MEYCEKLIYTTVEMQRLAHTRQRPTSMLFEGIAEAASNQLHQMSEGQSHHSDHEDLTVVPAPASSYKLLSRESMNMLCMLSLTLGCLAVLFFVFAQRHFKHDFCSGGHQYLPRPGQQSNKAEQDNGKPTDLSNHPGRPAMSGPAKVYDEYDRVDRR